MALTGVSVPPDLLLCRIRRLEWAPLIIRLLVVPGTMMVAPSQSREVDTMVLCPSGDGDAP